MSRRDLATLFFAIALAVAPAACERDEEEAGFGRDTLEIDIPDEVEEEVEAGARRVGGEVGEAVEKTGEAIERAGERLQEEAADTLPDDTL